MPEVQEVFRMATQKVTPDPGALDRQHTRQRRRSGERRVVAFAAAAAFAAVALVAAILVAGRDGGTEPATHPSSSPPRANESVGPSQTAQPAFNGVPPKGAEPSTPVHGDLVIRRGGIHPWWAYHVYADGRLIWLEEGQTGWLERRLTPEGIDLLRSGDYVDPASQLPESAWEDPEAKPYVPSWYAVCTSPETVRLLPQQAQDVLRGSDKMMTGVGPCPVVSIEEARMLDRSFRDVGLERSAGDGAISYSDNRVVNWFDPILPNGRELGCCPG